MSHQLEVSKRNNCVQTLFFLFPSAFASRFSSFVFFLYWIARLLYVVAVNAHAFLFFFLSRRLFFFFFHFVFFFSFFSYFNFLNTMNRQRYCVLFSPLVIFLFLLTLSSLFFFFSRILCTLFPSFFLFCNLRFVCVCVMSLHLRCTLTYLCVTQCVCAGRTKREKKTLFVCA